MARIRSIKPEFFRHEALYEAEKETKLPLRLAFAGLWTAADREGRFRWSARQLKLDCLPYDECDFSRVLDALMTRGFIVKYEVDGKEYGHIPSWHQHQVINNREKASDIPEPDENNILTREARVDDARATPLVQVQGEGKRREGEGKGKVSRSVADATRPVEDSKFEEFWKAYPRRDGPNPRKPAEQKFNALTKTGVDPDAMIDAAKRLAAEESRRGKIGTQFIPQAITWLNQQRWSDHAATAFAADDGMIEVLDQLQLEAWDEYGKQHLGKPYPRNRKGGWRFPSKWPPGYEANMVADVEKLLHGKGIQ
ncbi:hypothetical protein [Bradyrhizobium japonicum]|uniref:hypothetical protein n=1 Tax=Bradyrhizobium japonicum TaxID=375 RepID=UPI000462D6BD|nr:hypothetical protein [Bradyrhizobium japonicum]